MMLEEQQAFKEKKLNYNLVENIVNLQTEKKRQQLEILHLAYANERLWLLVSIVFSLVAVFVIVLLFVKYRKHYKFQIRQADEKLSALLEKLNQSNAEKEIRAQEIKEFLSDRDNHEEFEVLTPMLLQTEGESKFRQCFELLYPLFLSRLRDRIPSVTRREELLSMLIVLKQDNKRIADLMAIAPRSVLMLRHRFRQKIGMATEYSLDNFIEDILSSENAPTTATESVVPSQTEEKTSQV